MKSVLNLKNWHFHLGEIKLWDRVDHDVCYSATKAGGMLGKKGFFIDNNEWQDVTVPHDFCISQPAVPDGMESNGYKPRVCGWYYTEFDVPTGMKGDVYIDFEGVASHCEVYVNGVLVTRHYSGYTGFICEISDYILPINNIIALRVDNSRFEGWWYEGAGIYRPARIHFTDGPYLMPMETHIMQTELDGKWTVGVRYKAVGGEYSLKTSLFDAQENAVSEGGIELEIAKPELWSPDEPYLYTLKLELCWGDEVCDTEIHRIGFRTVEWRVDGGMFLNGVRTFVKGICCHQDHGGVGWAVPRTLIEYRLKKLKKMGCNAYRCAHHNVSAEFLDICDELGILVMNENRNFLSTEEVLDEVRYMVKNSRNHPSVFLYSLLNEEPLQKEIRGKRIAAKLKNAILELDESRAITGAINGAESIVGESAADVVDVMGMNYSIGSYEKLFKAQNKVVLGTENGPVYATRGVYKTDREAQVYSSYGDELTSFGQSYEATLKEATEKDYVAGVFLWSGFEYHGEPQPFVWPSVLSHWGMCDICGFEKDIYYLVKSFYSDEPTVRIVPGWQDYAEGEQVRVAVFTNGSAVRLYLNGELIGTSQALDNRAEFTVRYCPGILTAEADFGNVTVSDSTATAGETERLECAVSGDGVYSIIDISAVDCNGIDVNRADNTVTLTAEGGKIIGCCNGDPNTPLDCTADSIPLFHGKCQFVVEKLDESMHVKISSCGLDSIEMQM